MLFIGDVHGEFKTYLYVLFRMQHKGGKRGVSCSFQLGDMGIGFQKGQDGFKKDGKTWSPELGPEHKFIRGNHDSPALCRVHPNYAGDWRYFRKPDIFAVGGGYSVDYHWRTRNVSWWEDEQLNNRQMGQMFRFYKQYRPSIVVSHECPSVVKDAVLTNEEKRGKTSATEAKLQQMYEFHKPKLWIFGHHHKRYEVEVNGTMFVGLGELRYGKTSECVFEIPDLTWDGKGSEICLEPSSVM